MTGMSGAQANQAKKQTKKATQLRWKARICGVLKENSCIEFALAMIAPEKKKRRPLPGRTHRMCSGAADAVVLCANPSLDWLVFSSRDRR
jgi:hypothetical protein